MATVEYVNERLTAAGCMSRKKTAGALVGLHRR